MERQTLATITEIFQWYLENIFDMQNLRERCFLLQRLFWKRVQAQTSLVVSFCAEPCASKPPHKKKNQGYSSLLLWPLLSQTSSAKNVLFLCPTVYSPQESQWTLWGLVMLLWVSQPKGKVQGDKAAQTAITNYLCCLELSLDHCRAPFQPDSPDTLEFHGNLIIING